MSDTSQPDARPEPEGEPTYDLFLSHAGEDTAWCEDLANRLRNEGVRVWFDRWEVRPGDHLVARLNDGLEKSRKVVAVWSRAYFRDDKVWTLAESYSRQHPDVLARDRPLIPLLIDDCEIKPTLRTLISLDFRNPADFDLRMRQLLEALDLPRRDFALEPEEAFLERELTPADRGRRAYRRGKRFEDEVATLYDLLGFNVTRDRKLAGVQIGLQIEKREGGLTTQAIVECKDKQVTDKERDQILARKAVAQAVLPKHRWLAVSSRGFAARTRAALEKAGIDCTTYSELLAELVPLGTYAEHLIAECEEWVNDPQGWAGRDLFIRPDLDLDVTYERRAALGHLAKWLGNPRANLLVVLGDLGTGKSTLARFLAWQLAQGFRADPLRHPAPVLIPLREVRKEVSLDSIVVKHFRDRGLAGLSFPRFEHLLRRGKIVLLFDAFDEMADRVRWEVTQGNFQELRRAAQGDAKVILTCRTHYFKDRTEQVKLIGQGPSLTAAETALYKELRRQSGAEVVYLQEFNDEQIQEYLRRTRGASAGEDWERIRGIYNLRDLAQRPLLLEMIVKSLPHLKEGRSINAANLYKVYTNLWVERDYRKGRVILDPETKLDLMMDLAWAMWHRQQQAVSPRDLALFVAWRHAGKTVHLTEDEVEDIVREVQTASFLRRSRREGGGFTFIHRSFGEFFLARRILAGLTASPPRLSVLETRRLDRKVVYFLALLDDADSIRDPLRAVLSRPYIHRVSENALQVLYWSGRVRLGMEEQVNDVSNLRAALARRLPTGADLAGAQLQEIVLEWALLVGANLAKADLTKANLNAATLDGARLEEANLTEARAERLVARGVDFRQADCRSTFLAGADLSDCDFTGAQCEPHQFSSARLDRVRGLHRLPAARRALVSEVDVGSSCAVRSVAWSPEGDVLAAGNEHSMIQLFRPSDGRVFRTLPGETGKIRSLAWDPKGRTLASGSDHGWVALWEGTSGRLLRTLRGHAGEVSSVAWEPYGRSLASGSGDGTVKVWEALGGKLLWTLEGHKNSVRSVAWDPQGRTLASGSSDSTVSLWEAGSGNLLCTLQGHLGPIWAVSFAPHGRCLVAAGDAGGLEFCDLDRAETVLYLYMFGPGAWLALLPDGRFEGSPEALRYLSYLDPATDNSLAAEELLAEFHDPHAVREVLARYGGKEEGLGIGD